MTPTQISSEEKLKSLYDWSKWLIAINFSAVTGCIIKFDSSKNPELVPAIKWFTANVIASIVITFLYAVQFKPFYKKYVQYFLGLLQAFIFGMALFFFFSWLHLSNNGAARTKATTTDTLKVKLIN